MKGPTLKLLNCRRCDDIVRLTEGSARGCECGSSHGLVATEGWVRVTGPARVLEIAWESYDGIAEGEERAFGVLPKNKY